MAARTFQETNLWSTPIRDLGLTIEGTRLEPVIRGFERELELAGIRRLRPRFYLSTEWGVPFETVAIAIPFYLASPELTEMHAERVGVVEGFDPADILRYLRHEMGHVVNYAYCLYDREEWVKLFGSITQPYEDEYTPEPFSRRHVRHLDGWYAQKHPDEDWAETFAVWMTPGLDWRAEYAPWPVARAKLAWCDRVMAELADRDPEVTDDELDEDVGEIDYSIEDYYEDSLPEAGDMPPGLDGALRAILTELPRQGQMHPLATMIRAHARSLARSVFTWTGHFPERTRELLRHLADRADALALAYPAPHETTV
ncbi:MAG TPA: putative zinc-binding metallopeptidase, partial [Gemmatimonadales bacterium]